MHQGPCGFCGEKVKSGEQHSHNVVGTVEQSQMPVPKTHKYTPPPSRVVAADPESLKAKPE